MNPINEQLVRQIAEGIDESSIEPSGIAEPSLNNGISKELRELFGNDQEFLTGVNEILSVLNQ